MKLPTEFPALEDVRVRMRASLSSWSSWQQTSKGVEPIEVKVTQINIVRIQPIAPDLPLAYDGRQVMLYIKDNTHIGTRVHSDDPKRFRRVHLAECETIEGMRQDDSFDRYVYVPATGNDGYFNVEITDRSIGKTASDRVRLYVCKNCLDVLGLFHERANWPEFSFANFFRDYETFFSSLPQHTDITAPPASYPRKWPDISARYRESRNWTCEACGVNLYKSKGLLHCHHINRVKPDIRTQNLQALCAECHYEQPGHGQIPPSKAQRAALAEFRAAQGLPAGHRISTGAT